MTEDRAEEFAFNFRNLDAKSIQDRINTFESWLLTEALVGSTNFKQVEELTADFTDVRIGMTINGQEFNPEPLFRNIWMNLSSIAERAVIDRLADTARLDEVKDLVDSINRRVRRELEAVVEEKLGCRLDDIMSDEDNPYRDSW